MTSAYSLRQILQARLQSTLPTGRDRSVLVLALAAMVVCASVTPALAQGKPIPPVQKTLEAADGWPINITYYESNEKQNAAVVVLLHMEGSSQLAWTMPNNKSIADQLANQGFAVVAVDLRKHGLSKGAQGGRATARGRVDLKPNDYLAMVAGDLEAVWKFLFDEHQAQKLNMRKTALVAAGMSAVPAINFAANDWAKAPYDDAPTAASRTPQGQTIQALALISPDSSVPGMTTAKAMSFLKNPAFGIAWYFAVGKNDSFDRGSAEKLYKQVAGHAEERTYLEEYPTKLRGTQMLGKGLPVEKHLMGFLFKHVKNLNYQWEDRRPRYARSE